ncbi:alpha/beta fold hydrolase [Haliscomenobacter hydrossis]|uniref:Hydrolase or acyltransferase (Alpha/beta hydrolase superfamily)-like protein n=1 Tax=Haliscomenobacter hydrossis (strain ATCC 27775 / DSM 1100 / LMG 10767 / O) TaxID=760192 RepID=F4L4B6_HALH1|nr:alpha/beta hydrolase [Haliscomenobacter hydrossis]AEE51785.1 hydrolase or acyltransferase (alpha/beta hydrolase superfamily)-like protein [Haliscomenobacter hydrossis DSM 1100]
MEIKKRSAFKDPVQDIAWFENWVKTLEQTNDRQYQRIQLQTSLGRTQVWGLNLDDETLETLVIFPGARTTGLFWDFDNGLDNFGLKLRIYLVETNGLPNLSEGNTPDIQSLGYGEWAAEVLGQLKIQQAFVAGASFGGLICMKLGIVAPEKIKAAFLLNPGCLQPFSLSLKNLYYNLLPIIAPSPKNVAKFLDKAVFCKPTHQLSPSAEKLIIDYEVFALTRYQDNTQKPYYMDEQLTQVTVDTYLLEGDKDLLFPYEKSIANAQAKISTLKGVKVFENVAHGIETYAPALAYVGELIKNTVKGTEKK